MEKIIAMQSAETPSGQAVTLYEVQNFTDAGTTAEPNKQDPGIKRFELADGRPLTMVGRGEYKIEGTDEVFLVRDKDQGTSYAGTVLTPPNSR